MLDRAERGASVIRRWAPAATMTLLSFISYVDRNVLAQLSPVILRETHLSVQDYGYVLSAFSIAYCIGNPVWGRVIDRYGVRLGAAVAAIVWTCASAGHALAAGLGGFALARVVLGFGEGATFPAGLRTATQTLDPERRARGVALAYSGGSLGAVVTPLLVTPVALRWGWRGAFLCTGLLGAAWLATWAWVSRRPELGRATDAQDEAPPSWRDRSLWGFAAAYALGGLPLGFVLYYAPIHLGRGLGYGQATLGHVLWVPPLGWEVGYFFWGWMLDRSRGPARFARLLRLLAVLGLPFGAAPFVRSLPALLGLMFGAMFVSAGFVIVALGDVAERYRSRHGGYLAGIGAGAWAALMVPAMPLCGRLFDQGRYGAAYAIAAVCPLLGLVAWTALGGAADSQGRSTVL
jgi:ACS family hexuronate transporter-like MFS transporter